MLAVEVVRGVPVVTAPEEIDLANAATLQAALLQAAAHGRGTVVADMSGTRFCDSAGIHVLVRAHQAARAEGVELLLVVLPASGSVLRIFAITGIDRMIPSFPSLGEALAHTSPLPDCQQQPPATASGLLTGGAGD